MRRLWFTLVCIATCMLLYWMNAAVPHGPATGSMPDLHAPKAHPVSGGAHGMTLSPSFVRYTAQDPQALPPRRRRGEDATDASALGPEYARAAATLQDMEYVEVWRALCSWGIVRHCCRHISVADGDAVNAVLTPFVAQPSPLADPLGPEPQERRPEWGPLRCEDARWGGIFTGEMRAQPLPVFEAFLFSHELDILEARLWEGHGVVDHTFVIESAWTMRGNAKARFFRASRGTDADANGNGNADGNRNGNADVSDATAQHGNGGNDTSGGRVKGSTVVGDRKRVDWDAPLGDDVHKSVEADGITSMDDVIHVLRSQNASTSLTPQQWAAVTSVVEAQIPPRFRQWTRSRVSALVTDECEEYMIQVRAARKAGIERPQDMWPLQHAMRACVWEVVTRAMPGLAVNGEVRDDAVFLFNDLDELPSANLLRHLKHCVTRPDLDWPIRVDTSNLAFNLRSPCERGGEGPRYVIRRVGDVRREGSRKCFVEQLRGTKPLQAAHVSDGGLHMTYFGSMSVVDYKGVNHGEGGGLMPVLPQGDAALGPQGYCGVTANQVAQRRWLMRNDPPQLIQHWLMLKTNRLPPPSKGAAHRCGAPWLFTAFPTSFPDIWAYEDESELLE